MSITVGKSVARVDAFDKVTGRTKYYEDRMPAGALYIRIKHAEIAHGFVKSVDTAAAEAIDGVVKVLTCFDVPDIPFPTAGHPWSMDPGHQDVADRHLLNRHVRYYGDDVAVVIAENEVAAMQGVRALKVEYEELPFVLDVQKAMEPDAPQIHENYPGNILKHTDIRKGDYAAAIQEPGLIKVEGWYDTPTVQHCHIENHGCYAYEENGRMVVVSSTQIPHIIRRIVGQALGRPWADIEVIKPYIGGGFGVGIHNTLEAATFGLPVAFGPNYEKFKEARDLVTLGAARSVTDYEQLRTWFVPLRDNEEFLQKTSRIAKDYTTRHQGATGIIVKTIFH